MKVDIDTYLAEQIVLCADCCYSEGMGGDISNLLLKIFENFPELENEYSYIKDGAIRQIEYMKRKCQFS